tara:strand:+ start:298 stop:492 length:195 start_codon:yes stop_codon:yes gene_type:complete
MSDLKLVLFLIFAGIANIMYERIPIESKNVSTSTITDKGNACALGEFKYVFRGKDGIRSFIRGY